MLDAPHLLDPNHTEHPRVIDLGKVKRILRKQDPAQKTLVEHALPRPAVFYAVRDGKHNGVYVNATGGRLR